MTDENFDLTNEADPTERMTELQERAEPDAENERNAEFVGEETTPEFDVDEALAVIDDEA